MDILQVEKLHKNFSGIRVLTGVTFNVEEGDRLAMIGPNGAGKSTLLNLLGGQLEASSGRIRFAGHSIDSLPPNQRLRLGISRSFQTNSLFFQFSVLDNLMLAFSGAEKSSFSLFQPFEKRADLQEKARKLLKTVGLWQKRNNIIGTLSYGDQRLIEFAFAMASSPRLILLDEPSAGLPTAEARRFADIIRNLSGEAALIFCAHDMDLVFDLADSIMVLYLGEILIKGTPAEIRANAKVQEIYLGSDEPMEYAGT